MKNNRKYQWNPKVVLWKKKINKTDTKIGQGKKREDSSKSKIGDITTDLSDIKRIAKVYCEQLRIFWQPRWNGQIPWKMLFWCSETNFSVFGRGPHSNKQFLVTSRVSENSLQFNSILPLPTWILHPVPHVKVSVPHNCCSPPLQTLVTSPGCHLCFW